MEKTIKRKSFKFLVFAMIFVLVLELVSDYGIYAGTTSDQGQNDVEYVGDVDGDGIVSPKDVSLLKRFLARDTSVAIAVEDADVDEDGSITSKDVTLIRRYLSGGWGIELPEKSYEEPIDDEDVIPAEPISEKYYIDLMLEYDQKDAREMFDKLNEFRSSNSKYPLVYDYDLEKVAMQRAAEIAVLFDSENHNRPDGYNYKKTLEEFGFDISPRNWFYGENILFGSSSTMDMENAFASLAGDGSTAAIMNASFTCVGIGHVKVDKNDFWVQIFTDEEGRKSKKTDEFKGVKKVSVNIKSSLVTSVSCEYVSGETSVGRGKSVDAPVYGAKVVFGGSEAGEIPIRLAGRLSFNSEDEYVRASRGKIYGLKAGEGEITARALGKEASVKITVTEE